MVKGFFWLIVLFALFGGGTWLLALFLFIVIVGMVAKMFFSPFTSGGSN